MIGDVVTIRYWAGARAAAGRAEEAVEASTVGELLAAVRSRHEMDWLLPACSLLVDGVSVRSDNAGHRLPAGAVVDLLPPFAGG